MWVLTRFVVYWCCVDHEISFSKCETINFSLIHVFFPLFYHHPIHGPWKRFVQNGGEKKEVLFRNPAQTIERESQIKFRYRVILISSALIPEMQFATIHQSHEIFCHTISPLKVSFTMCGVINIHDSTCDYANCGALIAKKRIKAVLKWREMRFPEGNCGIQECSLVLSLKFMLVVCQRTWVVGWSSNVGHVAAPSATLFG